MADQEPFATVDDLQARWHELSQAEAKRAGTLLDDASAILRTQCDVSTTDPGLLKAVACEMVRRAMTADDTMAGATQSSQTVGPVSQSWTWQNPSGELYLTALEKKTLGIGEQKAMSIAMEDDDDR